MAKYLVETYYTCSFKVSHYLDDINEENLNNLEKNDDGKFEIIDIKLDNSCLLYTSPSPRDNRVSRMPSSA